MLYIINVVLIKSCINVQVPFLSGSEMAALKDNCTVDVLSLVCVCVCVFSNYMKYCIFLQSKKFTFLKFLDTLQCLSLNQERLVPLITKLLLRSSSSEDTAGERQCMETLVLAYFNH